MSAIQYEEYKNLHIFATEWRKYKAVSEYQDAETFRKNMQANSYVKMEYFNTKNGRPVIIFLLYKGIKITGKDLKKLIIPIKKNSSIALVVENKINSQSAKMLSTFKQHEIKIYLHENFTIIIPNGPLCYPHRIMGKDEVDNLLNKELYCNLFNLPNILAEDVQCIWIGANLGDVIEIKMPSYISGEVIQYKVVIPQSGRMVSIKATDEKEEEPDEDDDEDIKAIKESVDEDNEDEIDAVMETDVDIDVDV